MSSRRLENIYNCILWYTQQLHQCINAWPSLLVIIINYTDACLKDNGLYWPVCSPYLCIPPVWPIPSSVTLQIKAIYKYRKTTNYRLAAFTTTRVGQKGVLQRYLSTLIKNESISDISQWYNDKLICAPMTGPWKLMWICGVSTRAISMVNTQLADLGRLLNASCAWCSLQGSICSCPIRMSVLSGILGASIPHWSRHSKGLR